MQLPFVCCSETSNENAPFALGLVHSPYLQNSFFITEVVGNDARLFPSEGSHCAQRKRPEGAAVGNRFFQKVQPLQK
jgi:hypothetical protein